MRVIFVLRAILRVDPRLVRIFSVKS